MRKFKYAALLLAVIGLNACSKKTAGAKHGKDFSNTLRVMSYNVHHCNPPSKPRFIDVNAVAMAIKAQHPDLVAVQEIDVNTVRSGKINEASQIARITGMNFYFAKSIDTDGGDYGVLILSKFPISEMTTHRLPTDETTKGEHRVLATVKVTLPSGKQIRFGCTHLDAQHTETNRLLQITEINKLAEAEKLPFIIAGDLNARPGSKVINLLDEKFNRTCNSCGFTIPSVNPKSTIDFVAYLQKDKFNVISHEVVQEHYASDHLPVLSVIQYIP
ncbi:MAG: endonuclease/exonuclease/phosphatase family protein [Mucilaginibacter sp.]|uniref:endonuclease/exonuclease/phosphatase family protein n=1 Tax=Mucilaginibacter sp. TaxID=1882438 RepID=UPI0031A1AC03